MHKLVSILIVLQFVLITAFSQTSQNEKIKLANEYFLQGEFEKAFDIYDKLADRERQVIPEIHNNYFSILIRFKKFGDAEKYLKKIVQAYPGNLPYQADMVYLYHVSDRPTDKQNYIKQLTEAYKQNHYQLSQLAQLLYLRQLHDEAINIYQLARSRGNNPYLYALEMAAIYRSNNQKNEMVSEYINYAMTNPNNLSYIKNLFQNILSEEGDLDYLQTELITRSQANPDQLSFIDLLIWLELQRLDFYSAFVHAKAMDKRTDRPGDECMKVAAVAFENEAFDEAIEIYAYVSSAYLGSYNYPQAIQKMLQSKESKYKQVYPIDKSNMRQLSNDYQQVIQTMYGSAMSFEAIRSKALIHAYYLNELDSAVILLQSLITNPRINKTLISQSKIDLGDIYLFINEPWEASLLYSQVEKANKHAEVAYEAKLKNAKLQYYTGNFELAKSHLSILKKSTSKLIANDALDLEVLIENNTIQDSTEEALKRFSHAELLSFQNQFSTSISVLDKLLLDYPTHPLVDDALWLKSQLYFRTGKIKSALDALHVIVTDHSDGVLADDAAFRIAEITEKELKDTAKARELYRNFITNHPGSMYAAEARKRYRLLRGDLLN